MAVLLLLLNTALAAQTAVEVAPVPQIHSEEQAEARRAAEAQKRVLIEEFDRALFSGSRTRLAGLLDRVDPAVDPAVDRYSQFPLIVTAVRRPDMLEFLIGKGVRLPLLNQDLTEPGSDYNLLNAAVREGSVESYAVLKRAGLNFTEPCLKEQCYIYDMISSGVPVFGDVLVRDGLPFDLRRPVRVGGTTIPAAVAAAQSRAVLEWLVQAGADVNAPDGYGRTALLEACAFSSLDSVAFLLAHGADVRARRKDGQGVLHLLFDRLDHTTQPGAEMLLRRGADPNLLDDSGETPLFVLVRRTRARPDLCDCTEEESRRTRRRMLERAVQIMRTMQKAGARFDVRSKAGVTALETADADLIALLKEAER